MDESYQLRLIENPGASRPVGEVYLFSFLVHPVFVAVGHDIAWLRVTGIVALAATAAWTCSEAMHLCGVSDMSSSGLRRSERARTVTAMACASAASMLVFTLGVRVPGYRAVALLGLLLVAGGLARYLTRSRRGGPLLVGIGVWLTFVGKPPSAVAVAVVLLVMLSARRALSVRALGQGLAGAAVAAVVTLLVARLSPADALRYLKGGARLVSLLGDHSSLPQMLGWSRMEVRGLLVFGLPFLLVFAGYLVFSRDTMRDPARDPRVVGALNAVLVLLGLGTGVLGVRALGAVGQGAQALSVTLVLGLFAIAGAAGVLVVGTSEGGFGQRARHPADLRAFLVVLCVLPWAYAVGSNVSLTFSMAQAAVFWVIVLVAVEARSRQAIGGRSHWSALSVTGCMCACLAASVTWVSLHDGRSAIPPPRGAEAVQVLGGSVVLDHDTAVIGHALRAAAKSERMDDRTPVVDVTGMGAGYALILGGRPLGRAHLYGTWSGRVPSARFALSQVPCPDRATAYVIHAPSNPSDVSPALSVGATVDVLEDYDTVLEFTSHQYDKDWRMALLRPRPTLAAKLGCPGAVR
ncbi:hypothetical protein [Phycicoccus sp. Soil748]|uniref:hypothetical protein n=1 Tax=Phycicoccus sp. Soil748 TaxID=1736397 RepID=UPI001F1CE8B6|nr:hypothetical protein [Phycicoccus sp. Soil748]